MLTRQTRRPFTAAAVALALTTMAAPLLAGECREGDVVLATVAGTMVTAGELDAYAGTEVDSLKTQLYEARKRALESLINERLIAAAARERGLSADAYKASLVPRQAAVTQKEVDETMAVASGSRGSMPLDSFEQRVRLDVEARHRLQAYDNAVRRLRAANGVVVRLTRPLPLDFQRAMDGPALGGGPAAPVTIVEFADFQCPYCRSAAPMLHSLVERYAGNVRLVFKHMPLANHARALPAAKASVCAAQQQKFWPYHDRLYAGDDLSDDTLRNAASAIGLDMASFDRCVASESTAAIVAADAEQAHRLNVSATPTLFVNGKPVRGIGDPEALAQLIDEELSDHDVSAPTAVASVPSVSAGTR